MGAREGSSVALSHSASNPEYMNCLQALFSPSFLRRPTVHHPRVMPIPPHPAVATEPLPVTTEAYSITGCIQHHSWVL